MKKQSKRIISLILSCLMIFSGMTLSVFAETTHNVQVIKAPADGASYGKLYWNNTISHDGVNDIPFKIKPDSGYTNIEVTTDYGDTIFTADAESLTPDADGCISFHVNTGEIDRVGDNILTLKVYYADGTWTKNYNVFIQPQSGSYAYDFNDQTIDSAIDPSLGGFQKNSTDAKSYTASMVDGEKAFKILHSKTSQQDFQITKSLYGDCTISYDFYVSSKVKKDQLYLRFYLTTNGGGSSTYYNSTLTNFSDFETEKWYTVNYIISSSDKKIYQQFIADGVEKYKRSATLKDENIVSGQFRTDIINIKILDNTWDSTSFFAIDNIRMYKNIPVNASLKYTAGGEEVIEDNFLNGKISENADSITATLGGVISGEPAITLYKGDEAVTSDATVNGAEITFSNLYLESGASYKIRVENVKIASMSLQGYIEIPFETSNLANDIKESCTVSVNNEGSLKAGKVMTVNGTVSPGFKSAEIQFDGAKIADLSVTSDNSYSVRYLIPDNVSGSHTVKLVASYEALNEAVVKEQSITVCEKDAPDNSSTIDFEKYSAIAGTQMSYTQAASALGIKLFGDKPIYSIKSVADRGYTLEAVNDTSGEITVSNGYMEFYAFSDKSTKTSGKVSLEFDFYISRAHYSNTMRVIPYNASGSALRTTTIINQGSVSGIEGYFPAGWHSFKGEFDLDTREYSWNVDNNAAGAQGSITSSTDGISYYRIAISTFGKGDSWGLDNIKSEYYKSPIYASASYIKDDAEFAANKVISCDAEAIELNVRKEYKAFSENDVTVAINGASPVSVDAVYSAGTITVPLSELTIAEGNTVVVRVSENAYLVDNTYVDEPVVVEFVAGDSDGRAIIVENGKAKAYFGINADAAISATVYVVTYNGDALESLTSSEVSISEGASSYESTGLTLPSDYDEIKCFVWTGDDIKPLIKPIIK